MGEAPDRRSPLAVDALTGLDTRVRLLSRLDEALTRRSAPEPVAVLFIDIDHFKLVNDSLGHEAGDSVLREFASRLRRCVRPGDVIARFGGDEFVIAADALEHMAAGELAERILTAMSEPMTIGGREVVLSASVGIAVSRPDAMRADQILRDADTALYKAKADGRGRAQWFTADLRRQVVRRVELESELRLALRNDQLRVHYQPQVDLLTGQMVGVEALARWPHPERGDIPPQEFIRVAEDTGLIVPLGHWVLGEACWQMAAWRSRMRRGPGSLTVNVSPVQLNDPSFAADVKAVLAATRVEPSALCLEVTESALMQGSTRIVDVLAELRAHGVYIGVDDFGTGYSSLSRLRDLPVEIVKIDRTFVDGLGVEPDDSAIVASIMSLALAMGLHPIAEGVEERRQAVALTRLGCTVAQGYLFARPGPPDEIERLEGRRLWRAHRPSGLSPVRLALDTDQPARRGQSRFIDEFLDQIGFPTQAAGA